MSEDTISEADVRKEHLKTVHVPAHWAYLFGVLLGGLVLMVALIAAMGSGGG